MWCVFFSFFFLIWNGELNSSSSNSSSGYGDGPMEWNTYRKLSSRQNRFHVKHEHTIFLLFFFSSLRLFCTEHIFFISVWNLLFDCLSSMCLCVCTCEIFAIISNQSTKKFIMKKMCVWEILMKKKWCKRIASADWTVFKKLYGERSIWNKNSVIFKWKDEKNVMTENEHQKISKRIEPERRKTAQYRNHSRRNRKKCEFFGDCVCVSLAAHVALIFWRRRRQQRR